MTNWLHLDESRESWVFLLLGRSNLEHHPNSTLPVEDDQVEYWELGVGNADSLVNTNAERIDSPHINSETALIESLMAELDQYRYQGSTLITPDQATVNCLRRHLVSSNEQGTPSLRGLSHIDLEEELVQKFDQQLHDYDFARSAQTVPRLTETDPVQAVSTGSARKFWEVWTEVFRLLPMTTLKGEQL